MMKYVCTQQQQVAVPVSLHGVLILFGDATHESAATLAVA